MNDVVQIMYVIIATIFVIILLILSGVIVKLRDRPVIYSSSIRFLLTIVSGNALVCVSALLSVLPTSIGVCVLSNVCFQLGFTLAMGALVAKTWRLHIIFSDVNQFRIIVIQDAKLFMQLLVFVCVDAILFAIDYVAFPVVIVDDGDDDARCNSPVVVAALFSAWQGVLLICGTYLALKASVVPANLNEGKYIGWIVYNTSVMGFFYLLIYFLADLDTLLYVQTTLTLVGVVINTSILFAPKLYAIHAERNKVIHPSAVATTATAGRGAAGSDCQNTLEQLKTDFIAKYRDCRSKKIEAKRETERLTILQAELVAAENEWMQMAIEMQYKITQLRPASAALPYKNFFERQDWKRESFAKPMSPKYKPIHTIAGTHATQQADQSHKVTTAEAAIELATIVIGGRNDAHSQKDQEENDIKYEKEKEKEPVLVHVVETEADDQIRLHMPFGTFIF